MDSSAMKSLLSPRGGASRLNTSRLGPSLLPTYKRTPTKLSVSGRSTQSAQVVCKSQNHVLETFGSSLPVLVTEALTFADRSLSVSMNVSDEGWAWFVCSRRLLIWQARGGGSGGGGHHRVAQCRELVLPPSDLAHRAQLVAVYTSPGNQMPSCMAVSPEGTVRYWASIAHESGWIEASADLHGQECETLLCTPPHGCLVATTTATVVLVAAVRSSPTSATAQLLCRPFSAPHGWLGGIGRRVSSLFFGSGPPATHILETKLVKMVVRSGGGKGDWDVLLLAGHSLQKWLLSTGEAAERLVYEADISRVTRDALLDTFGDSMSDDIDIAYLDMQPTESGMMLLVSACAAAQAIPHYALVSFSTEDLVPPTNVSGLSPLGDDSLPFLQWMRPENEHRLQLLLGQSPLIYNNKYIVAFSHSGGESDILDVPGADIFGAALCRRLPIFFSRQHGLLSVSTTDVSPFDFITSHAGDLTNVSDAVSEIDIEELNVQTDSGPYLQIKTAFLKYVGKEMEQSKAHVLKVFPIDCEPAIGLDEPLDHAVIKLSLSFIDDIPSGDPRWADTKANTSAMNISASASLQILNQLIQKQNVLSWYISFLKDIGLWNHLGAVTRHGTVVATAHVLAEQAEKLVASVRLRKLQTEYNALIESIIKEVLKDRNVHPTGGLTHQDLFYREVSIVHKALQELGRWSEAVVHSGDNTPHQTATLLASATSLLLDVVENVHKSRKEKADVYRPSEAARVKFPGHVPWTVSSAKGGLKECLSVQRRLLLKAGVQGTGEAALRSELWDHIVGVTDITLDGHNARLESVRHTTEYPVHLQAYEAHRLAALHTFLDEGEYERATLLAEKYCDFQTLIEVCEKTDNQARLDYYMDKFGDEFSKLVFGWYIREKKHSRLLLGGHGGMPQQSVAQFLWEHPSLAWLHAIGTEDYLHASETLFTLAQQERQLLRRKKSMLSLSKLALLAAPDTTATDELNAQLELVAHQEALPEAVLTAFSYDFDNVRVFTPAEIIRFCTCDENLSANEFDFKKSLDLLSFVDDKMERNDLRAEIWCRAVLRDTWTELNPDSPLDAIQNLLFFKLIDLVNNLDEKPLDIVPPLEMILSAEGLGQLKDNSTFQYLLRVGYEHIMKMLQ